MTVQFWPALGVTTDRCIGPKFIDGTNGLSNCHK